MEERNNRSFVEEVRGQRQPPAGIPEIIQARVSAKRPPVSADFRGGMLENNRMKRRRGALDIFFSVVIHSLVLLAAILIPLYFTGALNVHPMETTYLAAPPPPPPPAAVRSIPRPRHFFASKQLYSPHVIPMHVAVVKDIQNAPQTSVGVPGGVIGGVLGGQLGGVMGGILGGMGHIAPPPPPKPVVHRGPYRVGGKVQPPQIIDEIQPQYPVIARQARVEGDVLIDSVIDTHGDVTQMKLVSGNPMLVAAAFNAVKEWKYRPTLLNGTPISVEMEVTVHFSLES